MGSDSPSHSYFTIFDQGEFMSALLNISYHTLVLENGTEIVNSVDRKPPPSIAYSAIDKYLIGSPQTELVDNLRRLNKTEKTNN